MTIPNEIYWNKWKKVAKCVTTKPQFLEIHFVIWILVVAKKIVSYFFRSFLLALVAYPFQTILFAFLTTNLMFWIHVLLENSIKMQKIIVHRELVVKLLYNITNCAFTDKWTKILSEYWMKWFEFLFKKSNEQWAHRHMADVIEWQLLSITFRSSGCSHF